MTAFCCAIQVALDEADASYAAEVRAKAERPLPACAPCSAAAMLSDSQAADAPMEEPLFEDDPMQGPPAHPPAADPPPPEPLDAARPPRVYHAGYQDDQYFRCTLGQFALYEPHLLHALARDGHELQGQKSGLWVPALDGVATADAPQLARTMWERYPRMEGGIAALGAACEG